MIISQKQIWTMLSIIQSIMDSGTLTDKSYNFAFDLLKQIHEQQSEELKDYSNEKTSD